MTGFQILFGRQEQHRSGRSTMGVLDLVVDGMNLTARVGESQTSPFLRDLTHAAVDLASVRRGRATVPFYLHDDPWELGLVREGDGALLTLFRGGASAEVAVHERHVRGDALMSGIARALDEQIARSDSADLRCARGVLQAHGPWIAESPRGTSWQSVIADDDEALSFGCDLLLRPPPDEPPPSVSRNDLLPLLVKSRMRIAVRGSERDLGDCFAFLVAERLADLAEQCLNASERGQPLQRRFEAGKLTGAVRLNDDGSLMLTIRKGQGTPTIGGETFPGLDARTFAQAVANFGKALSKTLLRNDRGQAQNLRLDALRASVRRLTAELRPKQELSSRVNSAPESYRAFALASVRKPAEEGPGLGHGKLRFVPRWEASIPGIDLGNSFLCGDRFVVTCARELAALGRNTGEVLWSRPAQRATALPTPGGLARVHHDGQINIHDYGTGEISLALRIAPRLGGVASGTVIHAPGLPKLLVVTEGERHLSAIDLVSGEVRWRVTLSRAGTTRLRRAGRLLLEVSGDQLLTAFDVQSGEIVWRLCTGAPCSIAPAFDHDTLFQVAGDAGQRRGRPWLYAVDAWTGAARFEVPLPSKPVPTGQPLLTADTVAVLTRDDRGMGLVAFDRSSGQLRYQLAPGLAPLNSSWLAVDGCLFANTDRGELIGVDAASGEIRTRLQLCAPPEDAVPRRLDPVLRSGALFVPQREVYVVRPRDGELLGQIPCELIPDLLRVDERCDVYIGEESGHLVAFGSAPRLSLVKR